jgi:hypothetical protein
LEWSQGSWKCRLSEQLLICIKFLLFWRAATGAAACKFSLHGCTTGGGKGGSGKGRVVEKWGGGDVRKGRGWECQLVHPARAPSRVRVSVVVDVSVCRHKYIYVFIYRCIYIIYVYIYIYIIIIYIYIHTDVHPVRPPSCRRRSLASGPAGRSSSVRLVPAWVKFVFCTGGVLY